MVSLFKFVESIWWMATFQPSNHTAALSTDTKKGLQGALNEDAWRVQSSDPSACKREREQLWHIFSYYVTSCQEQFAILLNCFTLNLGPGPCSYYKKCDTVCMRNIAKHLMFVPCCSQLVPFFFSDIAGEAKVCVGPPKRLNSPSACKLNHNEANGSQHKMRISMWDRCGYDDW